MPSREIHLLQAGRFESFLRQINTPDQTYKEWVVIAWYLIAQHYVDAFLDTKGHAEIDGHKQRWALLVNFDETRAISAPFRRLYKESKQARYEGTAFTASDLDHVRPLYEQVRNGMRAALAL